MCPAGLHPAGYASVVDEKYKPTEPTRHCLVAELGIKRLTV